MLVVEIVPEDELVEKLANFVAAGTPLKIKLALDPSAPDSKFIKVKLN